MEDTRLEFQGKCLKASAGFLFMKPCFDQFPHEIRERLRNSPFNICTACVQERSFKYGQYPLTERLNRAIDDIELAILAEDAPFGPQPVNPAPLVAKSRRRYYV